MQSVIFSWVDFVKAEEISALNKMDSRTVVENQAVSAGETVPCVVGKKRGILVDNKDREDSREICQKRPCSQLSQVLARTDALVQELDVLLKTRDTVYEFDPDDSVNIELISQARKYHYSDGKIPEQFYGLIARLIQDRNDSLTELSLKIHQILVGQRSNCSLDQFAVREAILTMAKRKCYDGRGTKFGNDEMDSLERIFWEVDSKYLNFLPVDQIAPIKSSRKIRDLVILFSLYSSLIWIFF